jgi:hypothetical protein
VREYSQYAWQNHELNNYQESSLAMKTCEVQINYPTDEVLGDWACATSLTLKNKQKDAEIYTANNYLDLIDLVAKVKNK